MKLSRFQPSRTIPLHFTQMQHPWTLQQPLILLMHLQSTQGNRKPSMGFFEG